jgi:hypothetical protein
MTLGSSNYTANMKKNFQEYTEIPIDLGERDQACQTAFGKEGKFILYLRKSH